MAGHGNDAGPGGQDEPDARRQALVSRVVHALLGLAGLALALYGGWLVADALRFAGVAEEATGTVIAVETVTTQGSGNEHVSFVPTIRYTAGDGTVREAQTHVSSTSYDFAVGERVAVLYDPAAPGKVRVSGLFSLWALPAAFFVAGIVLSGLVAASAVGLFQRGRGGDAA